MERCDTIVRDATVLDGSGGEAESQDVAILGDRICAVGPDLDLRAKTTIEARGLCLAPGFIDTHTHDDTFAIRDPRMLPKLTQGVTTVIVGNCGISAAPVRLRAEPPDPMNLLGDASAFNYPTFASYVEAVGQARPAVNVAALAGHTALRANHMDRLDRPATAGEIAEMRSQLGEALDHGALGLSSGLAYASARAAPVEELLALAEPLRYAGGIYTTHMRTEAALILDAMKEAAEIGRLSGVPVIISHLKCSGVDNWGRSAEILDALDTLRSHQRIACDCYPYAASSSTLDLLQVDERVTITITWSTPHADFAGWTLKKIAAHWGVTQREAAKRLQPAGAIYHSMSEQDMRRILRHPATMIGSDGLPNDPLPHPRLWGTFPRVLGRYSREEKMFSFAGAVHKMTGMPAHRFALEKRGLVKEDYYADLVLFDADRVIDTATFSDSVRRADGILHVWVNGVLSYAAGSATGDRGGRFVARGKQTWLDHQGDEGRR